MRLIEDLGMHPVGNKGRTERRGVYECPRCLKHLEFRTSNVNSGTTTKCKNCGKKADYETDSRLYRVWHNMRSRCSNPNTPYYLHYGGRGISVCDEWQNSFKSFELWAIDSNYKEHLEVDRINNDGNYEPSNCRLITHSENLKNRGDGISNKFSEDELSEMLEAIDRGIYPSVISKSLGNISIATLYRMKEEYLT